MEYNVFTFLWTCCYHQSNARTLRWILSYWSKDKPYNIITIFEGYVSSLTFCRDHQSIFYMMLRANILIRVITVLNVIDKPYQTSTNFQMWCDAITPIRISHAQPLRLPYVVEPYMLHWSIFINVNTSNNSFFLLTIFLSHTSCEKMLLHYTTTLLHFFGL